MMSKGPLVLTINSSFPEMEHLSSGLAADRMLSQHIRPYVNKGRKWERVLKCAPLIGDAYENTIGRRKLVAGLHGDRVKESALLLDLCLALAVRIPSNNKCVRSINSALLDARTKAIANAGAQALDREDAVVAAWGVAEPAFQKIEARAGLKVLNYSFAHHAFAKDSMSKEAEHEPAFADTLEDTNWPSWLVDRMDKEIDMADKILVGSSFVKDSFLTQGVADEKLEVLPYGVDTHFFSPRLSPAASRNGLKVLFVGQIGQRKGISYLFRAYNRFRRSGAVLTLVGRYLGNGQAFTPWRHMFTHVPYCAKENLLRIYQANDVFLFPTLLEGLPLVVLEAMACGLPVITTPNGPGDVVRDGRDGFIVPPRDEDAIVERLERLWKDPELRIWMGENARKRALDFSWASYQNQVATKIQAWITPSQIDMKKQQGLCGCSDPASYC